MSMISAQCDKLRETADKIQRIKNDNADWLWRDAITLSDAAEQMRDAANLILELRDNLQCANGAVRDAEHDESMAWDRVRKAEAENARLYELILDVADVLGKNDKLRELADRLRSAASGGAGNASDALSENAKMRKLLLDAWNEAMQVDGFWDYEHNDGEIPHYQERVRELGIEVDG